MSKTYRTDPAADIRSRRPLEPFRRKAGANWEHGGRGTRWMRGGWHDGSFAYVETDANADRPRGRQ